MKAKKNTKTKKIKENVKKLIKKYPTIVFDEISKDNNEIEISVFPAEWNDGEYNKEKYVKECHYLFKDIEKEFDNLIECDIEKNNSWQFYYIIF